jgi:hypothetical protein
VKNMHRSLYNLSFKNIEELNNISFNFDDVRNVLNSEIKIEKTGKVIITSNPDLMYEINDTNKQQKVNSFLTEQILKIQKRKKAIFESFIKKKDALLEKKIDNREADYRISVLDFYNFFGKENIIVTANENKIEERYNKISEEIIDKLYKIYKKREEDYKTKDIKIENKENSQKINSKIENQKKDIIQSYIFMKIFNYIKENFEYEEPYFEEVNEISYRNRKFLAEIPVISSLHLNFEESTIDLSDEKQIDFIKKETIKARLEFDREKKAILISENYLESDKDIYRIIGNDIQLIEKMKYIDKFKTSKKEILKKLIFEKFKEMMHKNIEKKGEKTYYIVDIKIYNIDIKKINLFNVVKSVVFKEIIDELRCYTVGFKDENGNNVKKSLKLNDMEVVSKLTEYRKEQIEILFRNEEKKIIKEDSEIKSDNEKKEYFKFVNEIKKKIDENLVELEKKNKDFSFNFKIKNMKKKKENIKKNRMVAIFLDDIHNILNGYERFFPGEKDYQNLDKDFLFIKIFIKLSEKFNFTIPMLGRYGEKISDKFVTLAFFNNINDVDIFLENMVYNVSDIHIIKNKYKIFRNSDIKKEMIFLNNEGKIEKKNVTYTEFLDCKYRKKYRINKKNPFDISVKDIFNYDEKIPNSFKYHRILGENIKYLFVNINYEKELKIKSLLFKNYENFIRTISVLDGVINSGNKILNFDKENENEIKLKNYICDENKFDLCINDSYIETMDYNITLNEKTQKLETVEQRLRKIISEKV